MVQGHGKEASEALTLVWTQGALWPSIPWPGSWAPAAMVVSPWDLLRLAWTSLSRPHSKHLVCLEVSTLLLSTCMNPPEPTCTEDIGDILTLPNQGPCVCLRRAEAVDSSRGLRVSGELGQVGLPLSFSCFNQQISPFLSITWLLRERTGI